MCITHTHTHTHTHTRIHSPHTYTHAHTNAHKHAHTLTQRLTKSMHDISIVARSQSNPGCTLSPGGQSNAQSQKSVMSIVSSYLAEVAKRGRMFAQSKQIDRVIEKVRQITVIEYSILYYYTYIYLYIYLFNKNVYIYIYIYRVEIFNNFILNTNIQYRLNVIVQCVQCVYNMYNNTHTQCVQ